nr:glycoside hydrolase family 43 protein [uncultured Bacteroides sp.]
MRLAMKNILAVMVLIAAIQVKAQNPIIQTWCTPDPAPMVHNGTVYLYTGHDEDGPNSFFNMLEWRCYSSTDMVNWTDYGSPLALETFKWAKDRAWASQCIARNGKFYWYVCCVDKGTNAMAIGVAVSKNPTGPFVDAIGKPLVTGDWAYIDPTVFIDDDEQAYLFFGNPTVFCVNLNKDMISYTGDVQEIEMTEESFGSPSMKKREKGVKYKDVYVEGPWFYKRNNKYYLLYAAGGIPEHISYSMSDHPTGPWKYMGVIMPLQDTHSFTNHCGVIDFKGKSYFFYHTGMLPGGGGFNRSSAIEEFTYNADGTFPTIKMTTEGVKPVGTLNPYRRTEAETMAFSKGVKTEQNDKTGVYVSDINEGDYIKVQAVDFGTISPKTVKATVASALRGGQIELHADAIDGPLLATINVPHTGGWEVWKTFQTKLLTDITGTHDIYFVFKGWKGIKLFNFDYWSFHK